MSKIKVGDRVRIVQEYHVCAGPLDGRCGVVTELRNSRDFPFRIQFDNGSEDIVHAVERVGKHPVIVITTDGVTTKATKRLGKKVICTATARCSKDDKFDFDTGATLAFARLVGAEIKFTEEEKPKLLNGKFICVQAKTSWWTKGKIYEFVNGCTCDDCHDGWGPFKDLDDLHRNVASDFIPLVED